MSSVLEKECPPESMDKSAGDVENSQGSGNVEDDKQPGTERLRSGRLDKQKGGMASVGRGRIELGSRKNTAIEGIVQKSINGIPSACPPVIEEPEEDQEKFNMSIDDLRKELSQSHSQQEDLVSTGCGINLTSQERKVGLLCLIRLF